MIGGASTLLATAATAAFRQPGEQGTVQGMVRDVGYAPSLAGALALPVGGMLAIAPPTRRIGATTAASGAALLGGQVAGTATFAALDGDRDFGTQHATLPPADDAAARSLAARTLAEVPADAEELVLWAPGTLRRNIPEQFEDAVAQRFGDDVSLTKLPTPPGYDQRQNAANGAAALRIVLDELAARPGGGPRVYLSGESNGAWSVGEVLADPEYRPRVERAVTWGMPGAAEHTFPTGTDPDVFQIRDEYDMVPRSVGGDQDALLEAMYGVFDGRPWEAVHLTGFLLNNPWDASLLARTGVRQLLPGGYDRDPHNYREHLANAAALLHGS